MALSPSDHAEILAKIGVFMEEEFAPILSRYYALSVAYAGKHPQNINNELRNAVTHMARALAASNRADADHQMDSALRHVERFKRDCLKVAVHYASKNAGELVRRAEREYGRVDPHLSLECVEIVRDRYSIMMGEVLGDPNASDKWELLLLRVEKLKDKTLESYKMLDTKRFWLPLLGLRVFRLMKNAWTVIGLAILAAALFTVMVPNQESFGEGVRAKLTDGIHALFPVRHKH